MKALLPTALAVALLASLPAHAALNSAESDLMDAYDGCKAIERGATRVIFTYKGYAEQPNVGLVKQNGDHAVAVNLVEKPDQNGRVVHQCISMLGPYPGSDALTEAVRADARARGLAEQPLDKTTDGTGTVLPFTNQGTGEVVTLIVSPGSGEQKFPMITLSNVWIAR